MQIITNAVPGSPINCGQGSETHQQIHALMVEHESLCYYCQAECIIVCGKFNHGVVFQFSNRATRDHMIPKSHGGTDDDIVLCCHECNQKLGSLSVKQRSKFINFGDRY